MFEENSNYNRYFAKICVFFPSLKTSREKEATRPWIEAHVFGVLKQTNVIINWVHAASSLTYPFCDFNRFLDLASKRSVSTNSSLAMRGRNPLSSSEQ